jgi:hypothetical protein
LVKSALFATLLPCATGGFMQLTTRANGTIEFSASPSELESFADMLRDAALYREDQRGTLMGADGITPIVIVPHDEYEVA